MSERPYVCSRMKGYMKAHGMVISSPPPIRWWQFLRRFRAWWNRPRVRKEFRKFQFPSSKPDPMNEVPFTVGPATPTPMQRPASRLLFMDFKYPEKTDE